MTNENITITTDEIEQPAKMSAFGNGDPGNGAEISPDDIIEAAEVVRDNEEPNSNTHTLVGGVLVAMAKEQKRVSEKTEKIINSETERQKSYEEAEEARNEVFQQTMEQYGELPSKVSELEEKIGVIDSTDVVGKDASWATKTLSKVYNAGDKILVKISGNPTFAGSGTQVFIRLYIRRNKTSTNIKTLYYVSGGDTPFESKEFVYTATEDCNLYVEGRWHTDETVHIEVHGSMAADIKEVQNDVLPIKTDVTNIKTDVTNIKTKDSRTIQRLFYCSKLNFNNTTHQIEIGVAYISSPFATSGRIEIPSQVIDYPFSASSTTLPVLVYDISTSTYKTTTMQELTANHYVLAAVNISGIGASSVVNKVYYSAIADCRINNENADTKTDNAISDINELNTILGISANLLNPTPKYQVGTLYNNNIQLSTESCADSTYYKVNRGKTLDIELQDGWTVRITQCDANKGNLLGNETYAAITSKTLRSDCEYIRISVNNTSYSSSNPITLDAVSADTCKVYISDAARIVDIENSTTKIEEISKLPDVIFGSEINFDDYKLSVYDERSGKWAGGGSSYNGIFIPVRKGYKIKITANANQGAMYSQVKELGVSKEPVLYADGFEDRVSITKGTTSTFEILDTCKYLWVANKSSVDNKPSYIGFDSIGGGQPVVVDDIISRNKFKEAQVLCMGQKGHNDTIKPFGFIHISDIHTSATDYGCFANMCKYLQNYETIKCAIATGDLVYDHYASPIDYYNKGLENTTKPVYNVIGNHDSGQQNSTTPSLDRVSTDAQCYEKYIAPYIGNWEVKSDGGGIAHPTGKSYYFNDFTDEKVRFIAICEFETDYELSETDPEHRLKYSREYRAMRQAQIDWLINSLATTPSGYGVIVALHQLDTVTVEDNNFVSDYLNGQSHAKIYTGNSDKDWLVRIFDAFKNHSTLNFTFSQTGAVVGTMVVNADFTNKTDCEFICAVCGHTHNDYVGYYANTNVRVLCVGSDNINYTGKYCPRKKGTITEDLFNLVNVDRNRKKVTIYRIGSDCSIEGQDRSRITIGY